MIPDPAKNTIKLSARGVREANGNTVTIRKKAKNYEGKKNCDIENKQEPIDTAGSTGDQRWKWQRPEDKIDATSGKQGPKNQTDPAAGG